MLLFRSRYCWLPLVDGCSRSECLGLCNIYFYIFAVVSAQMNQDLYLEDSSLFDDDASETQVLVDCDVWRANSCRTVSSKDTCLIMDRMTQFMGDQPSSTQVPVEPPEMFLPGCIVHIVREPKSILPFWKSWKLFEGDHNYRAFLPTRESFRDIKVTSHMFIDHLPWR